MRLDRRTRPACAQPRAEPFPARDTRSGRSAPSDHRPGGGEERGCVTCDQPQGREARKLTGAERTVPQGVPRDPDDSRPLEDEDGCQTGDERISLGREVAGLFICSATVGRDVQPLRKRLPLSASLMSPILAESPPFSPSPSPPPPPLHPSDLYVVVCLDTKKWKPTKLEVQAAQISSSSESSIRSRSGKSPTDTFAGRT